MVDSVLVTVPATTANIGPGFDCLGAALSLYNQFRFTRVSPDSAPLEIVVRGDERDRVSTDATNLVYTSFVKFYDHLQQPVPPVKIEIQMDVPLARGLGSSATAIVGGLVGANELAGKPLDLDAIAHLATEIEGHPDNVVPALIGGCRLAAALEGQWEICDIPWHADIVPIVAIPNFELSTEEARKVLPPTYSRADAIFNTAHLGLLVRGLETGKSAWVKAALHDRIHQPYRNALIPGYDTVRNGAIAAGALGMVISGAGPTLLALAHPSEVEAVAAAMETAWKTMGIGVKIHIAQIDPTGAVVQS